MTILSIVNLYREAGRPDINDGCFTLSTVLTADIKKNIFEIYSTNPTCIDDCCIDGTQTDLTEKLPANGKIDIDIRLPTSNSARLYTSTEDLLEKVPSISHGEFPSDYYLIDHNYYCLEDNEPAKISALKKICELIFYLSQLAIYQDSKHDGDYYKLVFIHAGGTNQSYPIEINTHVDSDLLGLPTPDIRVLENLCSQQAATAAHYQAERGVFTTTITDFLHQQARDNKFKYLITNWLKFIDQYQNNLSTYLSGFTFHKAKREIATAEFDLADQFSKVIGDITGKLFGIPLSLAATIGLLKADSFWEKSLMLLGLFIISWLIYEIVLNQREHLKRIKHAKDFVFNSLEGKQENYPDDLKQEVAQMITEINKREISLESKITFFQCFAWTPIFLGFVVFLGTYNVYSYMWRAGWQFILRVF